MGLVYTIDYTGALNPQETRERGIETEMGMGNRKGDGLTGQVTGNRKEDGLAGKGNILLFGGLVYLSPQPRQSSACAQLSEPYARWLLPKLSARSDSAWRCGASSGSRKR